MTDGAGGGGLRTAPHVGHKHGGTTAGVPRRSAAPLVGYSPQGGGGARPRARAERGLASVWLGGVPLARGSGGCVGRLKRMAELFQSNTTVYEKEHRQSVGGQYIEHIGLGIQGYCLSITPLRNHPCHAPLRRAP